MAWTHVFGNKNRNSQAGVATSLGSLAWTLALDSPEEPYSVNDAGPIVSASGYIWFVSQDTTGSDFTFYLYCVKSDGTVISKQTLQVNDVTPHTSGLLAALSTDVCLVPWTDRLRAFSPNLVVQTPTGLPSIWGMPISGQHTFTPGENSNYSILEGLSLGGAISCSTPGANSNTLTFDAGYTPQASDVGLSVVITGGTNINPGTYTVTGFTSSTWTLFNGSQNLTTAGGAGAAVAGQTDVGTLSVTTGTSVVYTAGTTPGTFHLIAQSVATPANQAVVTINVDTVSAALWEYVKTVGNPSTRHFAGPAVDASDNIYVAWDVTSGSTRFANISILNGSGSETFTQEITNFRYSVLAGNTTTSVDAAAFYLPLVDDPIGGGSHTFLKRVLFNGTTDWTYDHGVYLSFNRLLAPSYFNGKVAIFGAHGAITGFESVFQIDAVAGTLDWTFDGDPNDYANDTQCPSFAVSGNVFGGHLGINGVGDDPTVYSLAAASGVQNWKVTDAGAVQDGTVPIVGSDSFILFQTDAVIRLAVSDGAEQARIAAIRACKQPAAVASRMYVLCGDPPAGPTAGALKAYALSGGGGGVVTPFPPDSGAFPSDTDLHKDPPPLINAFPPLAGPYTPAFAAVTDLRLAPFGLTYVPRPAHIDTAKPTAVFWYHENRLYASFAGHTYCRDMLNPQGGWTDCGYGYVNSRFVISRFNFPNIAFLVANMNPIAYGDRATWVSLTHRNMTPDDLHVDIVPEKKVHFRPFDGGGKDREARKIADRLRVWGSVYRKGGNHKTGTLTWRGERGIEQSATIYEGLQEPDEIAQQEFPPSFYAWLLEVDMDLDDSVVDATILEAMLEYRPQD